MRGRAKTCNTTTWASVLGLHPFGFLVTKVSCCFPQRGLSCRLVSSLTEAMQASIGLVIWLLLTECCGMNSKPRDYPNDTSVNSLLHLISSVAPWSDRWFSKEEDHRRKVDHTDHRLADMLPEVSKHLCFILHFLHFAGSHIQNLMWPWQKAQTTLATFKYEQKENSSLCQRQMENSLSGWCCWFKWPGILTNFQKANFDRSDQHDLLSTRWKISLPSAALLQHFSAVSLKLSTCQFPLLHIPCISLKQRGTLRNACLGSARSYSWQQKLMDDIAPKFAFRGPCRVITMVP